MISIYHLLESFGRLDISNLPWHVWVNSLFWKAALRSWSEVSSTWTPTVVTPTPQRLTLNVNVFPACIFPSHHPSATSSAASMTSHWIWEMSPNESLSLNLSHDLDVENVWTDGYVPLSSSLFWSMSLAQRIQAKLVGCQRQVQQPEDESDDEDEYDKSSEESCCNKTGRDCRNLFYPPQDLWPLLKLQRQLEVRMVRGCSIGSYLKPVPPWRLVLFDLHLPNYWRRNCCA